MQNLNFIDLLNLEAHELQTMNAEVSYSSPKGVEENQDQEPDEKRIAKQVQQKSLAKSEDQKVASESKPKPEQHNWLGSCEEEEDWDLGEVRMKQNRELKTYVEKAIDSNQLG